jgi:two-component system nitrogen regulation sensor histidine kinase NtrY
MAEQLDQKQKKLLQAERLAAWQDIARHLAHEIKNPLAPIRTSIANLRLSMEKAPEKFREIFAESSDSIVEEVEKLRRLADEFARFARLPAPQKAPGDLNETIRRCLLLYESTPGSSIVFEPGKVPVLAFDADQMTEVIHNLVRNSLQAGATEIRVSTGVKPEAESEVVLSVADNGEGMDEATLRQVFAPYFTTRTAGTGLGMAIVQRIITEHGGRIAVDSQRGAGTRFLILLPANPS